jgi:hypothetical protein
VCVCVKVVLAAASRVSSFPLSRVQRPGAEVRGAHNLICRLINLASSPAPNETNARVGGSLSVIPRALLALGDN